MTDGELRDFQRNLPMALLRARERVMEHFRPILRDHDITEQQWRVVRALYGQTGIDATRLSDLTLLMMPSLTRILKTMEARDLIVRASVPGDHRRKSIRLSPQGTALHDRIAPLSEAEYRKMEAGLGAQRLERLYALLADLG